MSKETVYEDQGIGVLFSHAAVAKEFMRQNKIPKNDENIYTTIQMLAEEKAESYTPSEFLGDNPGSRVSKTFRHITGAPVYNNKNFKKRFANDTAYKNAKIEIGGSVNQLTQMIFKHVYNFKTTRKPNGQTNLKDPKSVTDFEYVQKGELSKEDLEMSHKIADANRHLRMMIEGYVFWSIAPLLREDKESLYQMLGDMGYNEISPKVLRSIANSKELAFLVTKLFGTLFASVKFTDFFKGMRWTPKGPKLLKGSKSSIES